MAGALHHRQGREVARAALLVVGRPRRRHVFIRRLAAAPEAGARGAKIQGHEKEAGQEGGEENRGEGKKERSEGAQEKGRQEEDSQEEDSQEEDSQEEDSPQEDRWQEGGQEALGFGSRRDGGPQLAPTTGS